MKDTVEGHTSERINVSHLLGGEYIGLEEVAEDVWSVCFGPVSPVRVCAQT